MTNDFNEDADMYQAAVDDIYYEEAKEHLKNMLLFFEVEYGPQSVLTADC